MDTTATPQNTEKHQFIPTLAHYEVLASLPITLQTSKELFDYQIEKLKSKGLAGYDIADPFRNRLPEKGMFFLLIPPPPKVLKLDELMALVELDGETGVNYLDPVHITDLVEIPMAASFLLNVEDGRGRLNIKPMVSREEIKKEKRHPYTTWRGIIHVILFPWVLNHHNMDLVGSEYNGVNVPDLCSFGGKPTLHNGWEGSANPRWGAPSAESVLVP